MWVSRREGDEKTVRRGGRGEKLRKEEKEERSWKRRHKNQAMREQRKEKKITRLNEGKR